MNVVVIGLGSMGKRRIRLIKELYPDFLIVGVESREDRRKEVFEQFEVKSYGSIEDVEEQIDCAFVCSSPLSHSIIISECLKRKWNVFTELNLVSDGYEENIKTSNDNGCVLFLSSTFLYREEIKYIQSKISKDVKWNYVYHIGQYLPDWHPWENYKDFFVGNKATNGCREIMAIELPWLSKAFGKITDIKSLSDKITELNIDYNDNYMILAEHESGSKGVLIVDVVSPVAVRKLEVYSENKYLSWDGTPESLKEFNTQSGKTETVNLDEKTEHNDNYRSFIVENAYKNEIIDFFECLINGKKAEYGFKEDMEILNLVDSLGA